MLTIRYIGATPHFCLAADELWERAEGAFPDRITQNFFQHGVGHFVVSSWNNGQIEELSKDNKSYWMAQSPDMELWLMLNTSPGYTVIDRDPLDDLRILP